MDQRLLNEAEEGDGVEGFYAVRSASLRTASNGKPYIDLVLADKSGKLSGKLWDATPEIFSGLREGGVAKVNAVVDSYRGALQLKLVKVRPAGEDEFDPADLLPETPADLAELDRERARLIGSVVDPDYRALLESFFDDPDFRAAFDRAPAARENHHAYIGGLYEHTLSLARLAESFCAATTVPLNRDLLLTGAFLHDIGKTEELGMEAAIDYTDRGKLLGHLIIGAMMVEARAGALPDFPVRKKWLVQHLILSHHGKHEYGSPVLPKVPEALALHHLDNLDAKTVAARRLIDQDTGGGSWTARSWMLDTQLFKESLGEQVDETPSAESDVGGLAAEDESPFGQGGLFG